MVRVPLSFLSPSSHPVAYERGTPMQAPAEVHHLTTVQTHRIRRSIPRQWRVLVAWILTEISLLVVAMLPVPAPVQWGAVIIAALAYVLFGLVAAHDAWCAWRQYRSDVIISAFRSRTRTPAMLAYFVATLPVSAPAFSLAYLANKAFDGFLVVLDALIGAWDFVVDDLEPQRVAGRLLNRHWRRLPWLRPWVLLLSAVLMVTTWPFAGGRETGLLMYPVFVALVYGSFRLAGHWVHRQVERHRQQVWTQLEPRLENPFFVQYLKDSGYSSLVERFTDRDTSAPSHEIFGQLPAGTWEELIDDYEW
jgi:hypothetical protein